MRIYQSRLSAQKVKKFNKNEKLALDDEIRKIIDDPSIGTEKKGDLSGISVYKYKIKTALYLLSYRLTDDEIELITIGSHANYYRDLKSYLKKR